MFSAKFVEDALLVTFEGSIEFTRVWTDSRTGKPGDLFAAIAGDNFNGHDFVLKACESGAKGALISQSDFKDKSKLSSNFCLIQVNNTTQALRALALAHRNRLSIPFFAIAGSNGKTTTKEWLAYLLGKLKSPQKVYKTLKSQNSILGIALSLLQIRQEELAIIEIGIDEPGWMDEHLKLVNPSHGLITTISEEHLTHLKNIQTVAEEELKLVEHLNTHDGSFAANLDCNWIKKAEFPQKTVSYSLNESAQLEGEFKGPSTLHAFGLEWETPLPGKHNAQNLLAALAGLHILEPSLSVNDMKLLNQTTSNFKGEAHRSVWLSYPNKFYVYDDSYNANPTSMELALKSFYELSKDKPKILVLGDMLDLGESTFKAHSEVLSSLESIDCEKVYLFGKFFREAFELNKSKKFNSYESFDDLQKHILEDLKPGQAIFIKGSRGMALERLIPVIEKIQN